MKTKQDAPSLNAADSGAASGFHADEGPVTLAVSSVVDGQIGVGQCRIGDPADARVLGGDAVTVITRGELDSKTTARVLRALALMLDRRTAMIERRPRGDA